MFGDDLVKNRSAWPGNSAITGLALSSRRTSFHMPPAHTWPRVLERSSTDNLSEVGDCGNLELPSHPISEPSRQPRCQCLASDGMSAPVVPSSFHLLCSQPSRPDLRPALYRTGLHLPGGQVAR